MGYSASINGDMIAEVVTRRATSHAHAACLAASEGQNGEVVDVVAGEVCVRFRIVSRDCGKVRRIK